MATDRLARWLFPCWQGSRDAFVNIEVLPCLSRRNIHRGSHRSLVKFEKEYLLVGLDRFNKVGIQRASDGSGLIRL